MMLPRLRSRSAIPALLRAAQLAALLALLTAWAAPAHGEPLLLEQLRGSFRSRVGSGEESSLLHGPGAHEHRRYLENRLDLEYSRGLWQSGLTLESREPAEFTRDFTRLRKLYLQYDRGDLFLRAGTLYGLSGQGLVLNLLEDRVLDFDNTAHGLQARLQRGGLRLEALGGAADYTDYRTPLVTDRHLLASAAAVYEAENGLTLGLDLLHDRLVERQDRQSLEPATVRAEIPAWVWGPQLGLDLERWQFFAQFSRKHTGSNRRQIPPLSRQMPIHLLELDSPAGGNGLYWSADFTGEGYGLSLEYKNYQYNLRRESSPAMPDNLDPLGALPFQHPPTVVKEHVYYLLSRFPLATDPSNQLGLQLEFNATPSPELTLQAVAGLAAKADKLLPDPLDGTLRRARGGFPLLPRLGSSYDPAWDSFLELRWHPVHRFQLHGGAGFRQLTAYNLRGSFGERTQAWTIPGESWMRWTRRFSTILKAEFQQVDSRFFPLGPAAEQYHNLYLGLTLGWAPHLSVTVSREATSEEMDPGEADSWDKVAAALRLGNRGTLNFSYGAEREGMVCSNGLCRHLPGFDGFRADLSLFF